MVAKIRFFKRITTFRPIYELENVFNSLRQLAFFLREEVMCFGSSDWIELLNELKEDDDSTCGNMIDIEKKGQNLYLGYVHDDPESPGERLEISKEELFKLMVQWEQLMKEKPEEITLSEQNGIFELVGKNDFKKIISEDTEC
jgi:hypothetical protein